MILKVNGMVKKVKHIKHLDGNCSTCYITCEDGTVYQSGHIMCCGINMGMEVIHTNINGKITNRIVG